MRTVSRYIAVTSLVLLLGASCEKNESAAPLVQIVPNGPAPIVQVDTVTTPRTEVKEFRIVAKRFEYSPATITVKKGDHVRFVLTTADVTHGIELPEYRVSITAAPGETKIAEFTATTPGTFTFHSNVYSGEGYPEMKGTLIVE